MESELYQPIPPKIRRHDQTLELQAPTGSKFVQSFLGRVIPASKQRPEELEHLVYRTQPLDNYKHKKKKSAFDLRPGKRKSLTAKEKRDLKVFQLPKEGYKYEDYVPLHSLWLEYMKDLVNLQSIREKALPQVTPKLLKADYHGCLLSVVRSKCPSYVGCVGIVIEETRNMFRMVTKEKNTLKNIPKANSVFMFDLDGHTFKIYGNQFRVKASERVRRKFKSKATLDL